METETTTLYGFDKATLDEMASTVTSTVNSIFADLQAVDDVIDDSEEAADIAAYDAVKARGEEEYPLQLVRRLVAGEHPVKVYRRYRGLTQTALATEAGTTASYISQIETRQRIGSTALLRRPRRRARCHGRRPHRGLQGYMMARHGLMQTDRDAGAQAPLYTTVPSPPTS